MADGLVPDNSQSLVRALHHSIASQQEFGETVDGSSLGNKDGTRGQLAADDFTRTEFYDEWGHTSGENQRRSFPEIGIDGDDSHRKLFLF